jgi:anti-sigma regulatory factor (Ser/Thr protein kinase)
VRKPDIDIRLTLAATWESVEAFITRFRREVAMPQGVRRFGVELLLREALNNAVLHGSGCDPEKRVHLRLRMDRRRLVVAVSDEGPGFNWRARRCWQADPDAESGRGMGIYRNCANRVRFNDAGNGVTILKRFDEGTS